MKAKKFTALIAALAMIISILPTSLITAGAEEDVRLISARFRSHPQTYSIFEKTEALPRNMLWAEFNTQIDHSSDYDKTTRTYHIGENYYQIEISRPEHGPKGQTHEAVKIVPDENDLSGIVRDEIDGNKHRYHGWQIGDPDDVHNLFHKDDEVKYQVGEYTINLYKLTKKPETFEETESMREVPIDTENVKLVHVTYTLSQDDIGAGYKLKCPMEEDAKEQIQELAMVGDMPAIIAPKADSTDVQAEGTKKVVSGWRVVTKKEGPDNLSAPIGDYLPDENKEGFADEDPNDHEITLQAILKEPTSYAYNITKNEADAESAFPTIDPTGSADPVSFNELAGSTEAPLKVEYNPTEEAASLTLRLVNKGNVREYIQIKSDNDNFSLKLNNMNADKEHAKLTYDAGGLNGGGTQFYIPSDTDVQNAKTQYQEDWVNYAELVISPKKGLAVGTHTAEIQTRCYNSRNMVRNICKLKIDISQKEVFVEPQSTEKFYGQELTDADITCKVYDDDEGSTLLEENKTAAQLGVNVTSAGMAKDAIVNGGTKYPFTAVTETSNSNYKVTLKSDTDTGITVKKTTPKKNNIITATGIKVSQNGTALSASKLSGRYVNTYSHDWVDGTLKWVDENDLITADNAGTAVLKAYQFTPEDKENYEVPDEEYASVMVSALELTNLRLKAASRAKKTYNGTAQPLTASDFTWDRLGNAIPENHLKITYKQTTPNDTTFADDEDFSSYTDAAPKDAGTYKVHATYPEGERYSEGIANVILTISPLTLQPNFSGSVVNKAYDGTTNAEINTENVKFKNKVTASDDVKIKESAIKKATFADAGYDFYYPKTVTISVDCKDALEGENASNYTLGAGLSTYHTTAYISSQRPIKLELTGENKTITKPYGKAHVFTVESYQEAAAQLEGHGLVKTDSISDVKANLTATDINGADGTKEDAPVGKYTVKASTPPASSYNYSITDDELGTLEVVKANPKVEGSVSAPNGLENNKLSTVELEGTFVNENNPSMKVTGTLSWVDGDTTMLQSGKRSYNWKFEPTGEDAKRYNSLTGSAEVTAGDKKPVPLKFDETNKEVIYDGNAHAVTAASTEQGTEITIEYAKTDIALHSETAGTVDWLRAAPKDAGTYEVRATAKVSGASAEKYADNEERTTLTILQAEPQGSVRAGNVDKGAYLNDSTLTPSFTDVNGEPLAGAARWLVQEGVQPGSVLVESGKDYEWEFDPTDENYKSVRGTAQITFNIDTRKAEAEIYNLPIGYGDIGDYARVNVDGTNLKVGDKIQFFRDAQMTDPESDIIEITEEMSDWTKVNIDDDALNTGSGVLYLNIVGSSAVAEIPYKTQIGFRLNPTQVYMAQGDEKEILLEISDSSYVLEGAEWSKPTDGAVEVTPTQDGSSATVKGIAEAGNATLTVTATFTHPDPQETAKVTTTNYVTITVTSEQAPDYVYTTKDADNVTSTGATLNGHIKITSYGNKTITPNAVGMFLIWEQGSEEKIRYGDKNPIVFSAEGEHDYSLAVDGLKPDTTYVYQAIGIAGDTVTNGDPVTFKTKPALSAEEFTVKEVDGKNVAAAKVTNSGSTTMEISLIAASYDSNGRLVGINMDTQLVEVNGESDLTAELPEGEKIKAFLWNTKTCEALEKAIEE